MIGKIVGLVHRYLKKPSTPYLCFAVINFTKRASLCRPIGSGGQWGSCPPIMYWKCFAGVLHS